MRLRMVACQRVATELLVVTITLCLMGQRVLLIIVPSYLLYLCPWTLHLSLLLLPSLPPQIHIPFVTFVIKIILSPFFPAVLKVQISWPILGAFSRIAIDLLGLFSLGSGETWPGCSLAWLALPPQCPLWSLSCLPPEPFSVSDYWILVCSAPPSWDPTCFMKVFAVALNLGCTWEPSGVFKYQCLGP